MDRPGSVSVTGKPGEETRKIFASCSSVAAVFGFALLFGFFCWFVAAAPAVDSLALAVATAAAWSVWLERKDHR